MNRLLKAFLLAFCFLFIFNSLWALEQTTLNKTKQVLQTAFRNGLYPSNFSGLQYAYFLQSSSLQYGYRQFCYDLATFECSQKTYGKQSLENEMRTYLDELIRQGYLKSYRFDKPFWNDGMNGVTLWVIYFTPGLDAMNDFEIGRKSVEKYQKGQDPNQSEPSWDEQDSMTAKQLKQWVDEQRTERVRQEEEQRAAQEEAKREAEAQYGQSLRESEAKLEAEKKKVEQMQNETQSETGSNQTNNKNPVQDELWH